MKRSTPCFSVSVAMGQPEHAPCKRTLTVPFSIAISSMSPPSAWIFGRISARAFCTFFSVVSLIFCFHHTSVLKLNALVTHGDKNVPVFRLAGTWRNVHDKRQIAAT